MYKHIRLRLVETETDGVTQTTLQILDQTDFGNQFGDEDCPTYSHDGFVLKSTEYPKAQIDGLYVRGFTPEQDNYVVIVPNEEWLKRCIATIESYNKFFNDAKPIDNTNTKIRIIG